MGKPSNETDLGKDADGFTWRTPPVGCSYSQVFYGIHSIRHMHGCVNRTPVQKGAAVRKEAKGTKRRNGSLSTVVDMRWNRGMDTRQ
jgi:hypothetical protein